MAMTVSASVSVEPSDESFPLRSSDDLRPLSDSLKGRYRGGPPPVVGLNSLPPGYSDGGGGLATGVEARENETAAGIADQNIGRFVYRFKVSLGNRCRFCFRGHLTEHMMKRNELCMIILYTPSITGEGISVIGF